MFAIDEINRDTDVLPGIKLGYTIYNVCGSTDILRAVMTLLNGLDKSETGANCTKPPTVQAIIGHSGSTPTMSFAKIVGRFHIPVVSYVFFFIHLLCVVIIKSFHVEISNKDTNSIHLKVHAFVFRQMLLQMCIFYLICFNKCNKFTISVFTD